MAQTIHDQAAEISTIKANDAAKDKRIDALEKENQELQRVAEPQQEYILISGDSPKRRR